MRHLFTVTVRATATAVGAAALALTFAATTHTVATAAHHDVKLAGLTAGSMCSHSRCG